MKNFAVTGVGGYVAPRHLRAIRDSGHRLAAALDPSDSVGVLDEFSLEVPFFKEAERFDRYLEKLRRGPAEHRIHYLSVCSPNHLHDAHCRLGLRVGADVLCEKPLVISPWNLAPLQELEVETGHRVFAVLQLRVHPALLALRAQLERETRGRPLDVVLTHVTPRGGWYDVSWKGDPEKSGGVPTNIGVHFFDLLGWLFGPLEDARVHLADRRRMGGFLAFARARVRFFLSVEPRDLPASPGDGKVVRSLTIEGERVDLSGGFDDLHTRVYEQILAGRGYGIDDARPAIALAHRLRTAPLSPVDDTAHEVVRGGG